MALRTRKTQLAFKIEGTPGTAETLTASDVIKHVGDFSLTGIEPVLFEDETQDANLGENPQFAPGIASWTMPPIRVAAAGHAASSSSGITKLPYDPLLQSAGLEGLNGDSGTDPVYICTVGAISSGPFIHGETVTVNSGESGVVVGTTWTGTTTLFIADDTGGGITAGTVTGATSGASATISAVAAYTAHAYRLSSDPDTSSTLTGGVYYDGKLMRVKGIRSNLQIVMDHANRGFFEFTPMGILHISSNTSESDTALLTGVNYPDRTAPASLGLGFALNDGSNSLTTLHNSLRLDLGNSVELREDSNNSGGWDVARIAQRAPRLTVNPDEVLKASYPFVDNWHQGTTARARWTLGSTVGNRFTFITPFLQTDSLSGTDRQGFRNWDGTFRCTKGSHTVSNNTFFGANNEVVIVHW